ncbi:hypothetical protein BsIDN1_33860 [Bacillus safensis]|uniref:histidine kinase n=1 Tax=Bacillus safensis TaxID=561879 RepID=A0A5S9MA45_BACIA|nr:hypothetical protein BsIDN1_33860 [Bacillus safensis]
MINTIYRNSKNEVNRFTTATNIPIRTKISVLQNMSPFFIEHTVYIIKECLTNVSKHAKASHVELVIVQQGDHIHLEIADNGVGFDEKKRESTFGHYGIIGMSERVRLLGGEIHLKSKKNEGTQVIVNIPLKKGVNTVSYRIVIVDDHYVVREGLKLILETDERFEVVGEASRRWRKGVRCHKKKNPPCIT